MTGSGKTGPRRRAHRGGADGRAAGAADRPQGRPHQPVPDVPRPRAGDFRPWIDEAPGQGGRRHARRVRRAAGRRRGARASAGWGYGPEQITRPARRRPTSRSTRPARSRACRSTSSGRCRRRRRDDARGRSATRSRATSRACSAWSASTPTRCRAASTSCSPTSSSTRGRRARRSTCRRSSAMVQQPPLRKLGVFELDQFFPPDDRTALAMKLNGLLASPAFAAWGAGQPLDVAVAAVHARRQGPLRHRHDRPPVRRGAPVRHVAACCPRSSRGCAARAARPTCGRCCTWTRSPGTCRRRPTRRRRSRS